MTTISILGLALIITLVVVVILFGAELFYVIWYRRRFRRATTAAASPLSAGLDSGQFGTPAASKELVLYLLFHKSQTSVNDASMPSAVSTAERVVFPPKAPTMEKEEEEAEKRDVEACEEATSGGNEDEREVSHMAEEEEEEEEDGVEKTGSLSRRSFAFEAKVTGTPCDSPPFYTPVASPTRDMVDGVDWRREAQPGFAAGYICSAQMDLELINT
ncbi:hypothetical protein Cni_G03342 [Canna indica]|uniref:Uncharacterized protein n=1 Tax=Canna indica TaxID=4628 RepID=A0AAQ3JTC4_9LILI|nr:hypothetical protein Cni_G03342 [Canna indica]